MCLNGSEKTVHRYKDMSTGSVDEAKLIGFRPWVMQRDESSNRLLDFLIEKKITKDQK